MGKIAFVFSGQGAQYPGMGNEIYQTSKAAEKVFALSEKVRPGTIAQCFEGTKEELSLTKNTQPCLYTVDLAIAEALKEAGIFAEGVAGFSLGEIPALVFSGRIEPQQGIELVVQRGFFMNEAAEKHPGTMVAVMRLTPEKIQELSQEYGVYPVNYNSPAQTVCAGKKEAIGRFAVAVKENRGMAIPLAVSGAFHSPFMEEASEALREALQGVTYHTPEIPVYANVTANPYPSSEEEAKKITATQVKSPVQWQKTIENMVKDGFTTFIEVGAGKTLTKLIEKIAPEVTAINVEKKEDIDNVKK